MISFVLPWALGALVSLPLLILLYMLRIRFKRQVVASILLFEKIAPVQESGRRLTRLRVSWLFILELLILTLLALAAAGPQLLRLHRHASLSIVLDDSLSMRAQTRGESTRTRALHYIQKTLAANDFTTLQVVIASQTPQVLPHLTPSQLPQALTRWSCYAPHAAIGSALIEVQKTVPPDTQILVVSDHAPTEAIANHKIHWVALGRPAGNVAVVKAVRSIRRHRQRCLLELTNFSDHPVSTVLQVNNRDTPISLPPQGHKRLTFDLMQGQHPFTAELPADALALDNRIVLLPNQPASVNTTISIADAQVASVLRSAVNASGLAHLLPRDAVNSQLIFNDRLSGSYPNQWQVSIITEKQIKAYSGPFVADYTHPLFQGLKLEGVIWGTGSKGSLPGLPLLSIGNIPVLSEKVETNGDRHYFLRFAPNASTLQQNPAWPILIWNLLALRQHHLPGPQPINVRLGTPVTFTPARTQQPIDLIFPDNRQQRVPIVNGQGIIEADMPGIYRLRSKGGAWRFAANYQAPAESDLSRTTSGAWGTWNPQTSQAQGAYPLVWALLLGGLLLTLLHTLLMPTAHREQWQ